MKMRKLNAVLTLISTTGFRIGSILVSYSLNNFSVISILMKEIKQRLLVVGHLNIKGDVKMSKSLGNTISIQDFLQENPSQLLRMFCILSKYQHGNSIY